MRSAMRRAGELLREIEPANGASENVRDGAAPNVTRKTAAHAAGMSERQRKTAIRLQAPSGVANRTIRVSEPTISTGWYPPKALKCKCRANSMGGQTGPQPSDLVGQAPRCFAAK
jgi:hypothetical protein